MASIAMYTEQPACTPTRFSVDTGTLAGYAITAYAASSYLSLGDSTQAERHARATLAVHEQAGAASRSPSREAIARLDLAIAQAHRHEPEEAAALGIQALGSSRVVDSVPVRAAALDAALLTGHPELHIREPYWQLIVDGVKTIKVRVGYPACGASPPAGN